MEGHAALHASGDALVLTTLRFADELRSPKSLDLPPAGKGRRDKELRLARDLIEALASPWNPEKYTDEYEAMLRDLIDKRIKGEKIVAPKLERPHAVKDLARALQQSLETSRGHLRAIPGGRTGTREPRARRGRRKKAA